MYLLPMQVNYLPLGSSRACKTFSGKLGANNLRPMGFRNHKMAETKFFEPPSSRTTATTNAPNRAILTAYKDRDSGDVVKRSYKNQGFHTTLFLVPQKEGGQRPVVNLRPISQFLPYEHFKMEGFHMLKDLLRKGDYLIKIDLKDAKYFIIPLSPDQPEIHTIPMGRDPLRIHLRTLWSGNCHTSFHQSFETGGGMANTVRSKVDR